MIYSNLWGLLLFGEQLTLLGSLGALLVGAGVVLATLSSRRAQSKPAAAAAAAGGGLGGSALSVSAAGAAAANEASRSKAPQYTELSTSAPGDNDAAKQGRGQKVVAGVT